MAERGVGAGSSVPAGSAAHRSTAQSLSASYWMHRWARWAKLPPGPLVYGAGSYDSRRSASVQERMPNSFLKMGTKRRDILLHHDADIAKNLTGTLIRF